MELKQKAYILLVYAMLWSALQPVLLAFGKGDIINEFFLIVYASSIPAAYVALRVLGKRDELHTILKDWKKIATIAVIGVVSFFPVEYGVTFAEGYVSASLASVMIRTSPLLMLVLLPIMLREKLSKYQIVALGLGFIGLYIGITAGNPFGIFQNANANIVLFLIAMAFVYAFSIIMVKRYIYDVSVVLFLSGVVMLLLVSVLFLLGGAHLYPLTTQQIGAALFMGIYFNVVNFSIYFYALRPVKDTVVSNIFSLSPFFTFIFADLILGQQIKIYYIAIAVLACVGIFIQSFDKKGSSYAAKTKHEGVKNMTIFDVTGVFANTGELALNNTIKDGGRVLAVKLPSVYSGHVNSMVYDDGHMNVYMDTNKSIDAETRFVKDIVGAKEGEFVVMKAGMLDECERFFEDLHQKINKAVDE